MQWLTEYYFVFGSVSLNWKNCSAVKLKTTWMDLITLFQVITWQ